MSTAADDPIATVLAERGVDGYAQYRIPALAVTTGGTVLAAWDGRPTLDDLPSPIDLLLRRSTDGGRTWGPRAVVRTGTGVQGFGDPSLVVDRSTGRIHLFHAAGTRAGFFESVEGLRPDDQVQHVDVAVSDDDGLTWTYRRITGQLKRPGITGLFAASGAGLCVPHGPYAGRLVQPMVLLDGGVITAAAAFSDDHGDTWRLGAPVGGGTNESAIAVLSDGRLLLHSRATPYRLAAVSEDGGATWSDPLPVPGLPDPSDNGSLLALADGPLVASSNLDPQLRRHTALSLSTDGGRTWPHQLVLCDGSSAYSCVAELPDGRLGVLYEQDGYRQLVFTAVDRIDLECAGPVDPVAAGTARPSEPVLEVLLRSVTPAPPTDWAPVGERYSYALETNGVDASAWKEVGQAWASTGTVVLASRETLAASLDTPRPGLRPGDILAFHARLRLPADAAVPGVVLEHPAGSTTPADPVDGTMVFGAPYPAVTVTAQDVAAGVVVARFTVPALGLTRELRILTA